MSHPVKYILTDIEGTTTSVSFVYDVLFPYFRENIEKLREMKLSPDVFEAFEQTIELSLELDGECISHTDEILAKLLQWSHQDKKITPLKTLQGVLWKEGYVSGQIKGHVYEDVPAALAAWKARHIQLGVFSSGSVQAQKLIFGYSEQGDLTPHFSNYFDTTTGGKREVETYRKISAEIDVKPENILFLSDIREELEAAKEAGYQTVQLLREGTEPSWDVTATDFSKISV
ncbi:MAG: mtnC [Crocinitomicaceae bacterium]|jgi:enolase-phosphatase E1|nr:mtnC [Crocinitomicaceae bacterium]